jgi:beta-glucosidase
VTVEVGVTNAGSRNGDEAVQLYVRDQVSSVARPVVALRGFQRVTLKPEETRTVRLPLGSDAFRLWNGDMREVWEPGRFDILTSLNNRDLQSVVLEIA